MKRSGGGWYIYLDRRAKAANVKSIRVLKRKLKKEWEDIPWNEIRRSVKTMPARAGRVCAATGRAHSLLVYIVIKISE